MRTCRNQYTLSLFDYPLWWVVCSADYVLYSGNVSYIRTFYPVLKKALDGFYPAHTNVTTGLVERPQGYGDFAFLPRNGAVTYYNALYSMALTSAAQLAECLGNEEDAERWRHRAAKM